jgi:hypothetical protein
MGYSGYSTGVLKASSVEYCAILSVPKRRLRGTQRVLGRARARCRRGADAVLAEFSRGFRGIQRVPRGY